jgi:hypothetical protein
MLGELGSQLTTASCELLRASLRRPVNRVFAAAVAASAHRERVLPCRHVGPQLGRRTGKFCLKMFSQASFHEAFSCIQSAAPDRTITACR